MGSSKKGQYVWLPARLAARITARRGTRTRLERLLHIPETSMSQWIRRRRRTRPWRIKQIQAAFDLGLMEDKQ